MKVLHLTAGNLFGGIETYLLTLARLRHLCPEMEPHFGVCFPGRLRDELTAPGAGPRPRRGAGQSPVDVSCGLGRRLKRLCATAGIEAVVTHGTWPHAVFAPVVRSVGARLVNFVHDEPRPVGTGSTAGPPALRRTLVVANSRFTARRPRSVFPGTPVEVVYLPGVSHRLSDREPLATSSGRTRPLTEARS